MSPKVEALYKSLAQALGLESLQADAQGTVQLEVGEQSIIYIFAELPDQIMLVSAVMELPLNIDYGSMLWLLKRIFIMVHCHLFRWPAIQPTILSFGDVCRLMIQCLVKNLLD